MPVFDSRPGPVRDVLAGQQREWRALIAAELRRAADPDPDPDADLAAFQIDAVLTATNTALRLGDDGAVARARRAVDRILAQRAGASCR
jgi:hypothetical protein